MPDFTVLSDKAEDLSAFISLTDDARNLIMEACHGRSAFSGIDPYGLRKEIEGLRRRMGEDRRQAQVSGHTKYAEDMVS